MTEKKRRRHDRARRFLRSRLPVLLVFLALSAGAGVWIRQQTRYTYVELDTDPGFTLVNSGNLIDSIRESLKAYSPAITIRFSAEGEYMENIADLVSELMARALEDTGEADEGDWLLYQYGGYTCEYGHTAQEDGFAYTIIIRPVYYMEYDQALEVEEELAAVLDGFSLSADASDYEKFCAVYDYLYSTCAYDSVHKNNDYYKLKCTAYGALIYHRAVCQGLCVTMYRLLRELDVDCRIITGQAVDEDGVTEAHSWVIVGLDGLYYNVDLTWDIQDQSHAYMLKCEQTFDSHERDEAFRTEEFLNAYPMAESDYLQTTDSTVEDPETAE